MNKNTVLIIDDNQTITHVVAAIAQKMGFETQLAYSFGELQQLIDKNHNFFCACVDFNLPDAPNGEAIDYVLQQGIATFVLTGQLDDKTRQTVLSKDVIDYITKETIQSFDYVGKLLQRLRNNLSVRILIVDDSEISRHHLKQLLTRQNFLTAEASNGVEALKVLSEYSDIQLVITDYEMPVVNGLQLVNEIRKSKSQEDIAIIAISSSGKGILPARFLKNGANDFLSKPFTAEEFYTRIFRNLEYIEHVAELQFAADHDFLTKLYNRRYFFENAQKLIKQSNANNQPLCCAILDLDHFKSINDTYGHDAGDIVLVQTAKRLLSHFPECLVARLGGEEFCILMPNINASEALGRLEFLCHHFETFNFHLPTQELQVTTSIGLAECLEQHISDTMIRADKALYFSKQNGRNQVSEDK